MVSRVFPDFNPEIRGFSETPPPESRFRAGGTGVSAGPPDGGRRGLTNSSGARGNRPHQGLQPPAVAGKALEDKLGHFLRVGVSC